MAPNEIHETVDLKLQSQALKLAQVVIESQNSSLPTEQIFPTGRDPRYQTHDSTRILFPCTHWTEPPSHFRLRDFFDRQTSRRVPVVRVINRKSGGRHVPNMDELVRELETTAAMPSMAMKVMR